MRWWQRCWPGLPSTPRPSAATPVPSHPTVCGTSRPAGLDACKPSPEQPASIRAGPAAILRWQCVACWCWLLVAVGWTAQRRTTRCGQASIWCTTACSGCSRSGPAHPHTAHTVRFAAGTGLAQVPAAVPPGGARAHLRWCSQAQDIDYPTLLTMNEADLKSIGLTAFGPRRKIFAAIQSFAVVLPVHRSHVAAWPRNPMPPTTPRCAHSTSPSPRSLRTCPCLHWHDVIAVWCARAAA